MKSFFKNTLALIVVLVLVVIAGGYVTFVRQPTELARVEKAIKVEKMKQAELTALLEQQDVSAAKASEAVNKWNARYKVVPDTLLSAAVVGRFNELTRSGFENFDITFDGATTTPEYSFYTHNVTGRAYFSSLYDFVWQVENSRQLYRINGLDLSHIDLITDVQTGDGDEEETRKRMQVMVSFSMKVESYFAGAEGISAPQIRMAGLQGVADLPVQVARETRVPRAVLPDSDPAINPFFPGILSQLPPNTHDLIEVEGDALVSIVGGKAVFQSGSEFRAVGVGEAVYLGVVTEIDPYEESVTARLNKGGIIDEVVLELYPDGERYRQAMGDVRLSPLGG